MHTASAGRDGHLLSVRPNPVPEESGAKRHGSALSSVRPGSVLPSKHWVGEQALEGQGVDGQSDFASSSPSEAASRQASGPHPSAELSEGTLSSSGGSGPHGCTVSHPRALGGMCLWVPGKTPSRAVAGGQALPG